SSEIISDVIAEVARQWLRAVQGINRVREVMIENACISDDKPCQCPGIFFGMRSCIGFNAGIRLWSSVLNQLLGHRAKCCRSYEGLANSSHSRRDWTFALAGGCGSGLRGRWLLSDSFSR